MLQRLLFLIVVLVAGPGLAVAEPITVPLDQTMLLRLPRGAAALVVGNPTLVDVTILHSNEIALTGKAYGISNLIVKDGQGAIILDRQIAVDTKLHTSALVLYRGSGRQTYTCGYACNLWAHPDDREPDGKSGGKSGDSGGNPCDSPDQTAKDGSNCGERSAYSRPGGGAGRPPSSSGLITLR